MVVNKQYMLLRVRMDGHRLAEGLDDGQNGASSGEAHIYACIDWAMTAARMMLWQMKALTEVDAVVYAAAAERLLRELRELIRGEGAPDDEDAKARLLRAIDEADRRVPADDAGTTTTPVPRRQGPRRRYRDSGLRAPVSQRCCEKFR